MTPGEPPYQRIANDLRAAINAGTYRPGDNIPTIEALQEQYGVGRQTVRSAVRELEAEGLVWARRKQGTVVRQPPGATPRTTRSRVMHRDDRGYYSDAESVAWQAIGPSEITWGVAPPDVVGLLGVDPSTPVLIRDRLVGAAPDDPRQIATSYLHPEVARDTVLAEVRTGPGGIYDRLEEMGHGPLRWREIISASAPTPTEARRLALLPGTPVLRILRPSWSAQTERVVDVTVFVMSAALYQVEHPVTRGPSARWPVEPAAAPNVPFPDSTPGSES